jgi:hypothetical protein
MPGTILPGIIQLASRPLLVYLQAAEHGHVEMAAADETERHGAVEGRRAGQGGNRPPAGIGEARLRHALLGDWAAADQPVLRLVAACSE